MDFGFLSPRCSRSSQIKLTFLPSHLADIAYTLARAGYHVVAAAKSVTDDSITAGYGKKTQLKVKLVATCFTTWLTKTRISNQFRTFRC